MEQKIIILIDNQKYFEPKKKPFLDEIRKFIKKEYNLPKESIIEIYNNDFSKRIYSGSDLEKLKEKNEQFNEYIIRINYKVKEMQNLHNSMTMIPPGIKNNINNFTEIKMNNERKKIYIHKYSNNNTKNNNKTNNINNIKINNININKNNNINKIKINNINTNKNNNINNNNLDENTNKILGLKNSFDKEKEKYNLNKEIDVNKFYEEVKLLKQKQQEEIESLEKELNELKQINKDLDNDNDNNNNIFLNNNIIEKLKNDIINEIKFGIKEEFKGKIQDIEKNNDQNGLNKQNKDYINEQIEKKGNEIFNKLNPVFGEIKKKQINIENKINKIKNIDNNENLEEDNNQNINPNKIKLNKKVLRNKNPKPENYINIQLQNNKNYEDKNNFYNNDINKDNNKGEIDDENIREEVEINLNKPNNKINNINAFNRQNQYLNIKEFPNPNNNYGKNNNHFGNFEKPQPKPINNNINIPQNNNNYNNNNYNNNNNPPLQKKNSKGLNLFPLFNNIFFVNQQQNIINGEKISEEKKEIIRKEYFKHIDEQNNNIVRIYADNFIRVNVLKIFNQANISKDVLEVVKYNISAVAECVGMNKDHYLPYYFPRIRQEKKEYRRSSVEAAIRFRKEFEISEADINQEQLLKRLEENNDNIYQTFQVFYG